LLTSSEEQDKVTVNGVFTGLNAFSETPERERVGVQLGVDTLDELEAELVFNDVDEVVVVVLLLDEVLEAVFE
jgi:hypothetical protein